MLLLSPYTQHKSRVNRSLKRKMSIFLSRFLLRYILTTAGIQIWFQNIGKIFQSAMSLLLILQAKGEMMWGCGGRILYLFLKIKSEKLRGKIQTEKYTNKYGIYTHGNVSLSNLNHFNHQENSR